MASILPPSRLSELFAFQVSLLRLSYKIIIIDALVRIINNLRSGPRCFSLAGWGLRFNIKNPKPNSIFNLYRGGDPLHENLSS